MRIIEHFLSTSDRRIRTRLRENEQAFTMVEIALSIAIVAFAMVAIIGVLPTGLQVQRDNREETIINQDGAYLLEAIRSGGLGLDELTNFVERITITNRSRGWSIGYFGSRLPEDGSQIPLINGHFIIGMLSVPTYQRVRGNYRGGKHVWSTNEVTALMRSISGSASQRFQSQEFRENAFTYLLTITIAPYSIFTNNIPSRNPDLAALNRLTTASNVMNNLYDVRLHFRWPVNISGNGEDMQYQVGKREQVFRSLVNGRLTPTNGSPFFDQNDPRFTNLFYFQPSTFAPPAK